MLPVLVNIMGGRKVLAWTRSSGTNGSSSRPEPSTTATPPRVRSRNSAAVKGLAANAQNTSSGASTSMLTWLRLARSGRFQRAYSQPMPAAAKTGKIMPAMRHSTPQSAKSQSRTTAIWSSAISAGAWPMPGNSISVALGPRSVMVTASE